MKYFLDTEFYEKPGSIDLMSIGMVDEDENSLYLLNRDCNLKAIWKENEWLKENVLAPIYQDFIHGDERNQKPFSLQTMQYIFNLTGYDKKEMAAKVAEFVGYSWNNGEFTPNDAPVFVAPVFWGYFADYDWVVFCWIFGRMIDLPKGFPMYCKDLKQLMDEYGLSKEWKRENNPDPKGEHNALVDAKWNLQLYKSIQKKLS